MHQAKACAPISGRSVAPGRLRTKGLVFQMAWSALELLGARRGLLEVLSLSLIHISEPTRPEPI
eukprot:2248512-Pyramimonas_sp.AAC.1